MSAEEKLEVQDVLIVDDHPVFRLGFKQLLKESPQVGEIFEATDGNEALRTMQNHKIGILFLDINMPELDGFQVIDAMSKLPSEKPKVVIVSMWGERYTVLNAYERDVHGFMTKVLDVSEIRRLIERVFDEEKYFSPAILEIIYKSVKPGEHRHTVILSEPEQNVLKLVCRQLTNEEISDELHISINTVKKHRQHIKDKIGAKSVVGFLHYGLTHRIVTLEGLKKSMENTRN